MKDVEIDGGDTVRAAVGVRLTRPGARSIRRSVELKDEITLTTRP